MTISYLRRPEGRIAYETFGTSGTLLVCSPAMGELRQSYRHLVPLLRAQGYRVVTMDLRGHGDSDASFSSYDDVALASDLLALIDEVGGPAVLVGNSMGAGASVIAAADRPDAVLGLALIGPFVRNPQGQTVGLQMAMMRLMLTKPWGPAALMAYYPQWIPGEKPADYAEHRALVKANLAKPGHWKAFSQTSHTTHAPAEARLAEITVPATVVMGEADVDWKDSAAEARWIGEQLNAPVTLLPGVGHYPQVQAPEATAAAIVALVEQATNA